jgi:NAD(P)H-dependent FMN reductase
MMTPSHRARARLIGLPGSLRRGSYSRAVLQAFARSLAGSAELTIRDILLPLYNEDEDGEFASPEVESFRAAIAASDGLVIATPEYNHGIPGVLKNALDWASRTVPAHSPTSPSSSCRYRRLSLAAYAPRRKSTIRCLQRRHA